MDNVLHAHTSKRIENVDDKNPNNYCLSCKDWYYPMQKTTTTLSDAEVAKLKAYDDVYSAMDACNVNILRDAGKWLDVIHSEARENRLGTDYVNEHPIITILIDKLTQLNGKRDVFNAYHAVRVNSEAYRERFTMDTTK